MTQTQTLDTVTVTNVIEVGSFILTSYPKKRPPISIPVIADTRPIIFNNIPIGLGELGVIFRDPSVVFLRNSSGELLVSVSDTEQYSINANGELIYSYEDN